MSDFVSLKINDVRTETASSVSIAFDLPQDQVQAFKYTPGQYLVLKSNINGEEIRRSYSICSAPYENELRVAIKKIEGGKFSTYANETLSAGMNMDVSTPDGLFVHKAASTAERQYMAFAAGSGITPIMSMIKHVLKTEAGAKFTLIYGNKTHKDIIFLEEIENLKNQYLDQFNVFFMLSQEENDSAFLQGRIDEEKCQILFNTLYDANDINAFYLCGPYEMIQTVKDHLIYIGVSKDKIHFELFTAPDAKKDNAITETKQQKKVDGVELTIKMDGTKQTYTVKNKEYLLDELNDAGADLPFSCKSGVCSTCRAKVVKGQVEMDANYSLEDDEVEAGFVLSCQSKALTDEVELDFDI